MSNLDNLLVSQLAGAMGTPAIKSGSKTPRILRGVVTDVGTVLLDTIPSEHTLPTDPNGEAYLGQESGNPGQVNVRHLSHYAPAEGDMVYVLDMEGDLIGLGKVNVGSTNGIPENSRLVKRSQIVANTGNLSYGATITGMVINDPVLTPDRMYLLTFRGKAVHITTTATPWWVVANDVTNGTEIILAEGGAIAPTPLPTFTRRRSHHETNEAPTADAYTDHTLVNVPLKAGRTYTFGLDIAWSLSATGRWILELRDGVNPIGRLADTGTSAAANQGVFSSTFDYVAAADGTKTFNVFADEISGAATLTLAGNASVPRQFWIDEEPAFSSLPVDAPGGGAFSLAGGALYSPALPTNLGDLIPKVYRGSPVDLIQFHQSAADPAQFAVYDVGRNPDYVEA